MLLNRPYLALPAVAVAMLAASLAAFAQTAAPPAGPYGQNGGPTYSQPGSTMQQPGAHHHRRRGPLQRALKGLALSPAERSRIHRVMRDYRLSRRSGHPETRAQVIAQIRGVLGPEERARFEQRLQRVLRHGGRAAGAYSNRGAGPDGMSGGQGNGPSRDGANGAPNAESGAEPAGPPAYPRNGP